MKIGMHATKGSFSDRWIEYCKQNNIEYKIVDAYQSNIIYQLSDCDAFMWHHNHGNYRDVLFAKQLLFSLEKAGKKVFPNFDTTWHFDDKVGEMYLLQAVGAPMVKSYVFYEKSDAINWARTTTFPKVFKLRGGAGSVNVRLAKTQKDSIKLINKAFGRGFSQFDHWGNFKERINRYKNGKDTLLGVLKGFCRLFVPPEFEKMHHWEKGYAYFQNFIPNNSFDIRVVVTGDKSFAIKRLVRKNDFRASGSGNIIYSKNEIDERCVKIAFDVNKKLNSQSIAYDFVFDENNNPLIVELSYGYAAKGYDPCPGYWTEDMQWHEGKFNPYGWQIESLQNNDQNK